jgi:RimJ/RimL family protein N-acetyltransferase
MTGTHALAAQLERRADRDIKSARNWQQGLPTLANATATLRELSVADAPSLLKHLSTAAVSRYIAPPPQSVAGFRTFVRWCRTQRRRGTHLCFGIVPSGELKPVGVLQLWPVEPDFSTSEWGFAVGEAFWGTGLFQAAADLALQFAFEELGVIRLEARAVENNGRGNGALRKLGARPEGTLRRSFRSRGLVANHVMWSILADDQWNGIRAKAPDNGVLGAAFSRYSSTS